MARIFDGCTFERGGRTFRINIEDDYDMGHPWEERYGNGLVRTVRSEDDKRAGEVIIGGERGQFYLYDVAETMKIARRDGWGLSDDNKAKFAARLGRKPTKGQIIAEAVEQDRDRMRCWLAGLWSWVGVIVTLMPEDELEDEPKPDYSHALWGIESDLGDYYIQEVAYDHADEILREIASETAERDWAATHNIATVEV